VNSENSARKNAAVEPSASAPDTLPTDDGDSQGLAERRQNHIFDSGLLRLVNDLVMSLSLDAKEVYFINPAGEKICGRSGSEICGQKTDWFDFVHQEDQVDLRNGLNNLPDTLEFEQQFRILRPDGQLRWLNATFNLIRDIHGNPQSIGSIAKDVSKRVETQYQLEEAKAVYHSLVESLPINVFRKDRQGRIVFGNKKYTSSVGLTPEEVIGKTDDDLFEKKWADKYKKDDAWVLQTGLPFHDIEHHPNQDGKISYVEVLKAPVTDMNGRRVGIQGMYWDVTARRQAEVATREAKELAEAASRAKTEFLANVSHEIRTPMNAIIGMTDLLLQTPTDREQREFLQMIQQSGESLLTLINDILDFSKIESGKLEIESSRFDVRESLGDSLRSLAFRAHSKKIELIVYFDPQIPASLIGDVTRLRQVLVNLTSNAIKFTEAGEVVVSVDCLKTENGKSQIRFKVSDTGIGIAESKRDSIFHEFEQADMSITRKYGGTGLGLAISSKLVELMGGDLRVTSVEGEGSRFFFTLEFAADTTDPIPERSLEGFSVLAIAENKTHLKNLEALLKSWNMTTFTARSMEQALRILKGMAVAEQPIDVVVSDAQFQNEDASVLAKSIRGTSELSGTGIILLASSRATELLYDRSELPIDDQLLKPVKEIDLFNSLQISLEAVDSQTTAHSNRTPGNERGKDLNVLVAEDNLVNQKLAVALLKKEGHRVTVAADGREAVEMFQRDSFDIVLMDVQMPDVDGFEATREIRRLESKSPIRTPIVALTAHAGSADREKCLASGMDRYLAKPIRSHDLFVLIAELTGGSTTTHSSYGDDSGSEMGKEVDWNHAFETVGGDKRLLKELITVFLDEQSKMLADIRRAVESSHAKELRLSAHSIKGALTHLGAMKAAHIAFQLETMGQNKELAEAGRMLEVFQKSLKLLTRELHRFKTEA